MSWLEACLRAAGTMVGIAMIAAGVFGVEKLHDRYPRTVEYIAASILLVGIFAVFTLIIKNWS